MPSRLRLLQSVGLRFHIVVISFCLMESAKTPNWIEEKGRDSLPCIQSIFIQSSSIRCFLVFSF